MGGGFGGMELRVKCMDGVLDGMVGVGLGRVGSKGGFPALKIQVVLVCYRILHTLSHPKMSKSETLSYCYGVGRVPGC